MTFMKHTWFSVSALLVLTHCSFFIDTMERFWSSVFFRARNMSHFSRRKGVKNEETPDHILSSSILPSVICSTRRSSSSIYCTSAPRPRISGIRWASRFKIQKKKSEIGTCFFGAGFSHRVSALHPIYHIHWLPHPHLELSQHGPKIRGVSRDQRSIHNRTDTPPMGVLCKLGYT